jgi:hypothetical protein
MISPASDIAMCSSRYAVVNIDRDVSEPSFYFWVFFGAITAFKQSIDQLTFPCIYSYTPEWRAV